MSSITTYNENLSKALLFAAVKNSASNVLIELTKLGGDPNYTNSKGKSVIKIALKARNVDYINWLNDNGIIYLDNICALCFDEAYNICVNCLTCYCCRECQVIDWPFHKQKCKGIIGPVTTRDIYSIQEAIIVNEEAIIVNEEDVVVNDEEVVNEPKHFPKQSNIKTKVYSQNNIRQKPLFIKRYNTKCW